MFCFCTIYFLRFFSRVRILYPACHTFAPLGPKTTSARGSIAVRQRLPPPSLDWQDVPCQFLVQNSSALERHVCDIAEDGFYMYQLEVS